MSFGVLLTVLLWSAPFRSLATEGKKFTEKNSFQLLCNFYTFQIAPRHGSAFVTLFILSKVERKSKSTSRTSSHLSASFQVHLSTALTTLLTSKTDFSGRKNDFDPVLRNNHVEQKTELEEWCVLTRVGLHGSLKSSFSAGLSVYGWILPINKTVTTRKMLFLTLNSSWKFSKLMHWVYTSIHSKDPLEADTPAPWAPTKKAFGEKSRIFLFIDSQALILPFMSVKRSGGGKEMVKFFLLPGNAGARRFSFIRLTQRRGKGEEERSNEIYEFIRRLRVIKALGNISSNKKRQIFRGEEYFFRVTQGRRWGDASSADEEAEKCRFIRKQVRAEGGDGKQWQKNDVRSR